MYMYIIAFGYKKKIIRPEGPAKKNNLAPKLSGKNFLAQKKIPSPPPQNIKWTVPKCVMVKYNRSK